MESGVVLGYIARYGLDGRTVLALGAANDSGDGGVDSGAGCVLSAAEAGREVATTLIKAWDASTYVLSA